ncbi:MAG: Kae1-associated serine/threonine protein kinase [Candidatus Diapherotrites archaeon]|mgnify:CR=1 FL=1|jgi:Kae1-associated kinase Bud32|uniref:non-specific serine/threonine protein kinase n=1 Tax=Candidatus Iainarchaeum sp. TaxID=3101447 RepID=A0A8T5GFL5_9ARCH|nr:Kae1-associated serine/threonine protein kinase [Candidatus Diapherotrites archaeon]MBT7241525.1 Kae1-associated serine/threonine protein kinase [Candidatus Diapherotrites archaeon]
MNKFYKKGAEAELTQVKYLEKKALSKKRIVKSYRDEKLDFSIRKKRVRSEAKIIRALAPIIKVPEIYLVDEKKCEIIMEFINGKMLKEIIEKKPGLATKAGEQIKKIHEQDIIHGDLTTSNILVDGEELCFIDFGLGYFSQKIEDKATDLIVFKKTFNATHSSLTMGWELVMKGYNPSEEMKKRMEVIEKRARYH